MSSVLHYVMGTITLYNLRVHEEGGKKDTTDINIMLSKEIWGGCSRRWNLQKGRTLIKTKTDILPLIEKLHKPIYVYSIGMIIASRKRYVSFPKRTTRGEKRI